MSNLLFSINATFPIFLLMITGYIFNKKGIISDAFASSMNTFVFKISLPVLLFRQLATTDFIHSWDTKFVLFCFITTLLSIVIVSIIAQFIDCDKGEFIQASYRSSAALLGIAYITNIYGEATMAPLMIIGAVPLYNAMAVVVLSISKKELSPALMKKTLIGIIKNPIIIGIVLGFLYSLSGLPFSSLMDTYFGYLAQTSTPLGLLAMGASINIEAMKGELKPSLVASFMKLIGLECLFLPLAIFLGFRNEQLVAICVMLGSATTVSSYVMSRNMGHDGVLTSNTVLITTLCASFTLTLYIFILKTLAFI